MLSGNFYFLYLKHDKKYQKPVSSSPVFQTGVTICVGSHSFINIPQVSRCMSVYIHNYIIHITKSTNKDIK